MHTMNHALQISPLPCKWCGAVLPSRDEWENHVVSEHNVSQSEAGQGLKVLEEAHMVLQNPKEAKELGKDNKDHHLDKD